MTQNYEQVVVSQLWAWKYSGNSFLFYAVSIHMALLNKLNFCWVEGADHAFSDNAGSSVAKQKFRITHWHTYNKVLINRGSMTF